MQPSINVIFENIFSNVKLFNDITSYKTERELLEVLLAHLFADGSHRCDATTIKAL